MFAVECVGDGIPARLHDGIEEHVLRVIADMHPADHAGSEMILNRRSEDAVLGHGWPPCAVLQRQQAPNGILAFQRLHEKRVGGRAEPKESREFDCGLPGGHFLQAPRAPDLQLPMLRLLVIVLFRHDLSVRIDEHFWLGDAPFLTNVWVAVSRSTRKSAAKVSCST